MYRAVGLSPVILQLTVRLAYLAYFPANYSQLPGDIIYQTEFADVSEPIVFVYRQDPDLFIITRGTNEDNDFGTDADYHEVDNEYGSFHHGIYAAAEWILPQVRPFIAGQTGGTIYFTGHSLGASCSQVLHILAMREFPSKTFYSFGYAPPPCMSVESAAIASPNMFTFVNGVDVVPTLSVGNAYGFVREEFPILSIIPTSWIVDYLRGILVLMDWDGYLDEFLYNLLWDLAPDLVQSLIDFENGKKFNVRYVVGQTYQIDVDVPKRLDDCLVDPAESLNILSVSTLAIDRHHCDEYVQAIDDLIWD
jgi:hypothetical protein